MITPNQKGLERQQFSFREFVHGEPALGRGHSEDSQRSHQAIVRPMPQRLTSLPWYAQEAA